MAVNRPNGGLALDLSVDGYIHSRPADVLPALTAPEFWRSIDPELELRCYHDRGEEGMRWYVNGRSTGMAGTAEVWLEPYRDGTLPHLFLRCGLEPSGWAGRRRSRRLVRTAERRLRSALFEVKDRLETAYPPPTRTPAQDPTPPPPARRAPTAPAVRPAGGPAGSSEPVGPRPSDPDRNPPIG